MADGPDSSRQGERTSTKLTAKRAASERVAAARAAEAKAVRRRNITVAGGSIFLVVIVIGAIVLVGLHTKKKVSATAVTPASSVVTNALTSAATSTLSSTPDISTIAGPPTPISDPALTANGKPQILYVGAEYCPNCAATRWPLALALSRFGTFSNLKTMYSSEDNIPTLSFRGASYSSKYVDFDSKEQVDGANKPLETLSAAENTVFQTQGGTASQATPGYPFIDFGGKWKQNGTSFDYTILKPLTPDAVASALTATTGKPGATMRASADVFTAIICQMDGGQPANVCTATSTLVATTALASIKK